MQVAQRLLAFIFMLFVHLAVIAAVLIVLLYEAQLAVWLCRRLWASVEQLRRRGRQAHASVTPIERIGGPRSCDSQGGH
jgi:hypothetical protein